jgi:NADH-ubiquinone oxidoreductase chain 4L
MINLLVNYSILVSVILGLCAFASLRSHLISTLLSLEFASLSVYLILFKLTLLISSEAYISLVYLTMAACEGALGLSILVTLIKNKGNDFLNYQSILQC